MSGVPLSGIVLAGGRSARFGSDKLVADIGGRPLLHCAIEALARVVREVILVIGPAGVPGLPGNLPVPLRLARDSRTGGGPLVGLAAGLDEAVWPTVVVVGGDMPRLVPAVLADLGARAAAGSAVALMDGDRVRPLPCALPRDDGLAAVRRLLEAHESSVWALLEAVGLSGIPEAEWRVLDPAGDSLVDVDRREDLS